MDWKMDCEGSAIEYALWRSGSMDRGVRTVLYGLEHSMWSMDYGVLAGVCTVEQGL